MTDKFEFAFRYILEVEGGYSDDPNDPGNWTGGSVGQGELKGTKWGISAASYPALDIRNLTQDKARVIYYRNYWEPMRCDEYSIYTALALFDAAVHSGPATAKRLWREAEGSVFRFVSRRIQHLLSLPHRELYETGWMRRVARLLEYMGNASQHRDFELALLQIFEGRRQYDLKPEKATLGITNEGEQKLMVRIPVKWYKPWTWIGGQKHDGIPDSTEGPQHN